MAEVDQLLSLDLVERLLITQFANYSDPNLEEDRGKVYVEKVEKLLSVDSTNAGLDDYLEDEMKGSLVTNKLDLYSSVKVGRAYVTKFIDQAKIHMQKIRSMYLATRGIVDDQELYEYISRVKKVTSKTTRAYDATFKPLHVQGNRSMMDLLLSLLKDNKVECSKESMETVDLAIKLTTLRSCSLVDNPTNAITKDIVEDATASMSLSSEINKSVMQSVTIDRMMKKAIKRLVDLTEWDHAGSTKRIANSLFSKIGRIVDPSSIIDIFHFQRLTIVIDKKSSYPMTRVHLGRLELFLKSVSNMVIAFPLVAKQGPYKEYIIRLIELLDATTNGNVNRYGQVMKGVRQTLIASLDKSQVLGCNAADAYLSTLDNWRSQAIRVIMPYVLSTAISTEDGINLSSIYKAFPHPDVDHKALFDSMDGIDEPNRVSKKGYLYFEGETRRVLALSLRSQGHNVRLTKSFRDINGSAETMVNLLVESSNGIKGGRDLWAEASSVAWSNVEISLETEIFPIRDVIIKAESKASAVDLRDDDKLSIYSPKTLIKLQNISKSLANKNDVITKLKEDAINPSMDKSDYIVSEAIEFFENIIAKHEEFECSKGVSWETKVTSSYSSDALEPEDICASDLADFVESCSSASYNVSTEGKFGEKHKEVTRMFYLAQRHIKTITQVTERATKQVIKHQAGVAITQNSRARRKYLEDITRSMAETAGDRIPLFISFDMEKFSKKFPMALIRIFGKIMSEIYGEYYLKRLDIVFRAARVFYAKDTFLGVRSGVMGGFEGFLNFMWSSIHEVIMRISQITAGVRGHLSTFSDDGIMMIMIPKSLTPAEVTSRVKIIQATYKKMGLEFNLNKTLVSKEVWEYLGDVGYYGKILPAYIKEINSIGATKNARVIETIGDKFVNLYSQVRSVLTHHCNPYIANLINHIVGIQEIKRRWKNITGELDIKLIHCLYLAIVPFSYGGFRVPSLTEMSLISNTPRDSEFISDLILLKPTYPTFVNYVVSLFNMKVTAVNNKRKILTSESYFNIEMCDSSGRALYEDAAEYIYVMVSDKGVANPMTGVIGCQLDRVVESLDNVAPGRLFSIVNSLPEIVEYAETVRIAKTSAALKIMPLKRIKFLQSSDTRRISRNFRSLQNHTPKKGESYDVMKTLIDVAAASYPGIVLSGIVEAPRSILSAKKSKNMESIASIEVNVPDAPSLATIPLVEGIELFSPPVTQLKWLSEASGSKSERSEMVFYDNLARMVAFSPAISPFVTVMLEALNYDIKRVVATVPWNINRGTKPRDTFVHLPSYMKSSIIVHPTGFYEELFNSKSDISLDRSTVDANIRLLAYNASFMSGNKGGIPKELIKSFPVYSDLTKLKDTMTNFMPKYKIAKGQDRISIPAPLGIATKEVSKSTIDYFNKSYARYTIEASETVSLANECYNKMDPSMLHLAAGLVVSDLENVISSLMRSVATKVTLPVLTGPFISVLPRAIGRAAMMNMEPRLMAQAYITACRFRLKSEMTAVTTYDMVENNRFDDFIDTMRNRAKGEIDKPSEGGGESDTQVDLEEDDKDPIRAKASKMSPLYSLEELAEIKTPLGYEATSELRHKVSEAKLAAITLYPAIAELISVMTDAELMKAAIHELYLYGASTPSAIVVPRSSGRVNDKLPDAIIRHVRKAITITKSENSCYNSLVSKNDSWFQALDDEILYDLTLQVISDLLSPSTHREVPYNSVMAKAVFSIRLYKLLLDLSVVVAGIGNKEIRNADRIIDKRAPYKSKKDITKESRIKSFENYISAVKEAHSGREAILKTLEYEHVDTTCISDLRLVNKFLTSLRKSEHYTLYRGSLSVVTMQNTFQLFKLLSMNPSSVIKTMNNLFSSRAKDAVESIMAKVKVTSLDSTCVRTSGISPIESSTLVKTLFYDNITLDRKFNYQEVLQHLMASEAYRTALNRDDMLKDLYLFDPTLPVASFELAKYCKGFKIFQEPIEKGSLAYISFTVRGDRAMIQNIVNVLKYPGITYDVVPYLSVENQYIMTLVKTYKSTLPLNLCKITSTTIPFGHVRSSDTLSTVLRTTVGSARGAPVSAMAMMTIFGDSSAVLTASGETFSGSPTSIVIKAAKQAASSGRGGLKELGVTVYTLILYDLEVKSARANGRTPLSVLEILEAVKSALKTTKSFSLLTDIGAMFHFIRTASLQPSTMEELVPITKLLSIIPNVTLIGSVYPAIANHLVKKYKLVADELAKNIDNNVLELMGDLSSRFYIVEEHHESLRMIMVKPASERAKEREILDEIEGHMFKTYKDADA